MSEKEMPSTSSKNMDKNSDSNDIPSNLNVLSEDFDPIEALYSQNLKRTNNKAIKSYCNVAAFESALNKFGIQQVGNPNKSKLKTPADSIETKPVSKTQTEIVTDSDNPFRRRFQEYQMPVKGTGMKIRHSRNLMKKMEDFNEGPISILYNLWKSQEKMIVYVRKEHGVRGYIMGYLVVFDKHTNLLLKNAYEIWKRRKFKFSENNASLGTETNCSKRLKKLGIKLPETEIKSVDRKYVIVKRKIDQIIIRGTQVCLVRTANKNDEEKLDKCIL